MLFPKKNNNNNNVHTNFSSLFDRTRSESSPATLENPPPSPSKKKFKDVMPTKYSRTSDWSSVYWIW